MAFEGHVFPGQPLAMSQHGWCTNTWPLLPSVGLSPLWAIFALELSDGLAKALPVLCLSLMLFLLIFPPPLFPP